MSSPSRPPTETELTEAARAFSLGAMLGVFPQPDIIVPPISGPGIGSYERYEYCLAHASRQEREHRATAKARCLELAEVSRRLRLARAA